MAYVKRTDAVWVEIDPSTLEAGMKAGYDKYKAQYRAMKEAREMFEQGMNDEAELPEGKRLVFGYNFGKLSVAVVNAEVVKSKAKPAQSLSQYLAAQTNGGHRA
jgi:hypothetical protein